MPKYRHLSNETRIYPDFSLTVGPGEVVDTDRKLGNHPNFALVKPKKAAAKKAAPKSDPTPEVEATDPPTED